MNRRCMRCGGIGKAKEDVFWQHDPFAWEIYRDTIMGWWHEECAYQSYLDT